MTDQMTFFDIGLIPLDSWQYDEDSGNVMCRCPLCEVCCDVLLESIECVGMRWKCVGSVEHDNYKHF